MGTLATSLWNKSESHIYLGQYEAQELSRNYILQLLQNEKHSFSISNMPVYWKGKQRILKPGIQNWQTPNIKVYFPKARISGVWRAGRTETCSWVKAGVNPQVFFSVTRKTTTSLPNTMASEIKLSELAVLTTASLCKRLQKSKTK